MGHIESHACEIKLVGRVLLACAILAISCASVHAIDIAYDSGNTLSLGTDVVLESAFCIDTILWGIKPPEADVSLSGDKDKKAGFELGLQSEGIYDGRLENIIDTAMVWFLLADNVRLDTGQFKAQFGEEVLRGKKKRPYPFHSESSKELTPGTDRGASISIRNLFGFARLDFGVFNGGGDGSAIIDFTSALSTAKVSIKPEIGDVIALEAGYSVMYGIKALGILEHTVGQTAFLNLEIKMAKNTLVNLFSEYMERRVISGAVNDYSGWSFGNFNLASLRIEAFEAFATFEIIRLNSMFTMQGDRLVVSSGLCVYPADEMRLSLVYKGELGLYDEAYVQEVSTLLFYRL